MHTLYSCQSRRGTKTLSTLPAHPARPPARLASKRPYLRSNGWALPLSALSPFYDAGHLLRRALTYLSQSPKYSVDRRDVLLR